MPTIYDNITKNLVEGLKTSLSVSKRGDFCVGYFNLRGWKTISSTIDSISAEEGEPSCRLIVGMGADNSKTVSNYYKGTEKVATQKIVVERRKYFAESLVRQLTYGIPTSEDEAGLRKLAKQLSKGVLQVKFFGSYPLHAKLYLAHTNGESSPMVGYVGSSNLTLAGLRQQGELNIDVVDSDATNDLANWFEERWKDKWCLDISEELAAIIEESWAGGPIDPYDIYIKTAYELSREAIEGSREFKVPKLFREEMLGFQMQAVTLAAERLYKHDGVIISDVVGLGKTLVASAVAKTFQDDYGGNVLVICPPNLQKMWKDYFHIYEIAGEVLSLGRVNDLKEKKRFHTVIIDESHNLRNRESRRYSWVKDYIDTNACRVILLTATPYNKEFKDIASQLRLFFDPSADLGIRPETYIRSLLDEKKTFRVMHPSTLISSIAAFEQSDKVDDWRELMRVFMVRRTRSHIKRNYAEYDEERKQHYLTFNNGKKYYFPDRVPKCVNFQMDDTKPDDQYALLYSEAVIHGIGNLKLPRYGVGEYLLERYKDASDESLSSEEKRIIENLSRAGTRLIGFTGSNLFKRLESSGPAFLLSVRRHIVRNAVYLSALEEKGMFPIGDVYSDFVEDEDEATLFSDSINNANSIDAFMDLGRKIYKSIVSPNVDNVDENIGAEKIKFIYTKYFQNKIATDLISDCEALIKILNLVPEWNPEGDRKLNALCDLCSKIHKGDKLLIFTQFKDTAKYMYAEFVKRGIDGVAMVHGGTADILDQVKKFSPVSNKHSGDVTKGSTRIMVTTDSLSEGQNLQDCSVVVNFDMPWATIRLVQRVGRVDRIGQKADKIFCYSFLPENGVDRVLGLRERLINRINENAEVIGSDENFFEGIQVNLSQVYDGTINLEDPDDETDLISRAYDIWTQAVKENSGLKKRIEKLPNVVYSAKRTTGTTGTLAYIKTSNSQHILAQVDDKGEVISQSQSEILDLLQCEPEEEKMDIADNHHDLVAKSIEYIKEIQEDMGGQLGGPNTVKHRVYIKLKSYLEENKGSLFTEDLSRAFDGVYKYPFKESARDKLRRLLSQGIDDESLARTVVTMWDEGNLLAVPKDSEDFETDIVCSMGLVK